MLITETQTFNFKIICKLNVNCWDFDLLCGEFLLLSHYTRQRHYLKKLQNMSIRHPNSSANIYSKKCFEQVVCF